MILLWGPLEDAPVREVLDLLTKRRAHVTVLDDTHLLSTRLDPRSDDLLLRTASATFPLSEVTAFYPRPYRRTTAPDFPCHPSARRHLDTMSARLWRWAATTGATVLNRPTPAATNSTKTDQTRLAQQCGLAVPPSILTTDPGFLTAFAREHGELIAKGAGGTRTIVHRLDPGGTARLPHLSTAPTYFQAYIAGRNFRVHIVGQQAFTVAITASQTDYRYGGCRMAPAVLPHDILEKCRLVCRQLDLPLAGIDLIHGDDGQWYFLEANPSPAFTFFCDHRAVAAAIAERLLAAEALNQ